MASGGKTTFSETNVRRRRALERNKMKDISRKNPGLFRRKILNCARWPNGQMEKFGTLCKRTSSQFDAEKLQRKVDSVDWLWYRINNSYENEDIRQLSGCMNEAARPERRSVAFVESAENEEMT